MFLYARGKLKQPSCGLLFVFATITVLCSGSDVNDTETGEVTDLMGKSANKVDIVFLVQSTGKMGIHNWKRTVLFMNYLADAFDISKIGTRLGIVAEGHTFHLVLDLNRVIKKHLLMRALTLIPLPVGDQKIGKGLRDVRDLVLKPSARSNVPHIVIVLTDGNSVDDVTEPVQELLKDGAEIFAVGLGNDISPYQLQRIASFPYSTHIYHGDFDEVMKVASKVIAEIYNRHFCGGVMVLIRHLLLRKLPRMKKISDECNV